MMYVVKLKFRPGAHHLSFLLPVTSYSPTGLIGFSFPKTMPTIIRIANRSRIAAQIPFNPHMLKVILLKFVLKGVKLPPEGFSASKVLTRFLD